MIAKSRPRWLAGDLSSRSTFSRNRNGGRFIAAAAGGSATTARPSCRRCRRLVERLGHGVVLAGEAADEQLVVGQLARPASSLVEHERDVLADVLAAGGSGST